ncbi:uncharacterized protein C1orf131 [Thrips palmi]|uniref:Uncharacterized protein C1orf131 n=1 Tax=Thrips palmi TaxID=161013 RepID=A0A6P8YGA9_THRPL|nr:uncharacterized protein C1orf131 [Thrips palmi]
MSEGLVQTKSSQLRKSTDFQEVVFTSYKAKEKNAAATAPASRRKFEQDQMNRSEEKERFMKKTRHEIIKLGLSGFDPSKRQKTKEALAISLGAKPKKTKPMNYKEFKEMHSKRKKEETEKTAFNNIGKTPTGEALAKIKTRMDLNKRAPRGDRKGGILDTYGRVKKNDIPRPKKK